MPDESHPVPFEMGERTEPSTYFPERRSPEVIVVEVAVELRIRAPEALAHPEGFDVNSFLDPILRRCVVERTQEIGVSAGDEVHGGERAGEELIDPDEQ